MQTVDRSAIRRYSTGRPRFPIAMVARRALQVVNGQASHIVFRPVVVLAARSLGPGPTRLWLVKLAHSLDQTGTVVDLPRGEHDGRAGTPARPTERAA